MLGVKNNGTETLKARFDGEDYEFPPGGENPVVLSDEAAKHIFGYGGDEADKQRALARMGWLTTNTQMDAALARLNDFQFLSVDKVQFKEVAKIDPKREHVAPARAEKMEIEIPTLAGKKAKK